MATRRGIVKKTPLEQFERVRATGIRAITTCWREVRLHGAKGIALIADQTPVLSSYRWAKLHDLVPIYRTQEEAIREMGSTETGPEA